MVTLDRIENPQFMDVRVGTLGRDRHLYIFSGIAVFNWHWESREYFESPVENLHISFASFPGTLPRITLSSIVDHTATASLAGFGAGETSKKDTWTIIVNSVSAYFPSGDVDMPEYGLDIGLSVHGYDVTVKRVSFQMMVLANA